MTFAAPRRAGVSEFAHDRDAFDGLSYLYANEDVRRVIGFDPEGAWRHWLDEGHVQDRYPSGVARAAPRVHDPAAPRRPFGLNVFGPFDAVSGLGTAARNLAEAVAASGIPHALRGYDVETGHARITDAEAARPFAYSVNLVLANADQIRRVAGLYPDGAFDNAYTIAVWAWELAAFRADFHAAFALVDEVWTNSRFELASISACAPVPVHLMPLPVPIPPDRDRAAAREAFGLPRNAFVVLCPFDAGSTERRKNPVAAIRAFRAAFGNDPRRILVVKYHGAHAALARRIHDAAGGAPNIRLLGARLAPDAMDALRAACDALVSAHRSEGFGLNLAEFLASGRIVVATDATGSRDFLDETTGFPVPCRLAEVTERAGPYLEHAVWAEPDEDALARALTEAAASQAEATRRGANARARMGAAFSPAAIGARMRARLEALGLADATPDATAATAHASVTRHVPELAGRERLLWPARLPCFSLVLAGATDPAHAATRASLEAQLYPFWEALLVDPALPPPEDATARAVLRGPDLRIRLVEAPGAEPAGDASLAAHLAAVSASIGAYLVFLPPGAALAPNALMQIAHALDLPAAPELLSVGVSDDTADLPPYEAHLDGAAASRPLVARKSLFLSEAAEHPPEASREQVLAGMARRARNAVHLAGPLCRLPREAGPRDMRGETQAPAVTAADTELPQAALSLRFATEAAHAAWAGVLGTWSDLDGGPAPARCFDAIREGAAELLRAETAEHLVLVGEGVEPPRGDWIGQTIAALADPLNAAAVARFDGERLDPADAATGFFATTRRTLARIARLEEAPTGPAEAASMLGLRIVSPAGIAARRQRLAPGAPARPTSEQPGPGQPEPERPTALTPEAHAALLSGLGLFDAEHYANIAPDVVAAGGDLLLHYCAHGWREHRAPNFYMDPVWYRACFMHADEEEVDPVLHWHRFRNSGVRPSRHFDPAWVRRSCALPPDTDPLAFFLAHRRDANISPLREFDAAWYRARRRDIAYRHVDPFEHYMRFGAAEGVNPSAEFDTRFYAATHMRGVAPLDPLLRNPLLHHLEARDHRPVITSQRAALRQEIDRLALLGASTIDLGFAWYDGLPQRVDALRTYLSEPSLFMTFRVVFTNEAILALSDRGDERLAEALRLPYTDTYDDPDICARLAECCADPRCLRDGHRPVIAFMRGAGGKAIETFGLRIAARLATAHGVAAKLVFID